MTLSVISGLKIYSGRESLEEQSSSIQTTYAFVYAEERPHNLLPSSFFFFLFSYCGKIDIEH